MSGCRTTHLAQEGDAGATHSLTGFQPDMKGTRNVFSQIDRTQRVFP